MAFPAQAVSWKADILTNIQRNAKNDKQEL